MSKFPIQPFTRRMFGKPPTRASILIALRRMAERGEIDGVPYCQVVTLIRSNCVQPAVFVDYNGGQVIGFDVDDDGDVRGIA